MADDRSSPPDAEAAKSSSRVDELVDRGLECYGDGELHAAMDQWEYVLSIVPGHERAADYLKYVRDNFALLESRFAAAAEVAQVSAELDVPFGLESVGDDSDFYDTVELETAIETTRAKSGIERYIESVDEGWFLDELPDGRADALPPPPAESADELADELEAVSAGLMDAVGEGEEPEVLELEADLPPDDAEAFELAPSGAMRGFASEGPLEADLEFEPGVGPSVDLDAAVAAPQLDLNDIELAPADSSDAGGDYDDDDEMTVERGAAKPLASAIGDPLADEEITVPGGEEPLPFADNLNLSSDALAAIRPGTADGNPSDETTIERPGIVKRGFALGDLDDLDGEMRHDDRVLADDGPEVKIAFRGKVEEDLDDEMTIERPAVGGRPASPHPVDLSALDDEMTVERHPAVIVDQSLLVEDLETIDRRLDSRATTELDREDSDDGDFGRGQQTRELRRQESADGADQIVADVLAGLDDSASVGESDEERLRRRLTKLVQCAGGHAARGRTKIAMELLDIALDEDPDSAVAQKVIHRHRDLVVEIYELFLGSMDSVPVVAVPMQELGANELDNRSVFLLSRIDGTMTLDEVLDVSGMPRLESFRYLCRMLVKGILEIR